MPPKKKAKGKKAKSSTGDSVDAGVEGASVFDTAPPIVIEADPVYYVTLDMRLLNWSYLNFKFRTKTTTRLFALKVSGVFALCVRAFAFWILKMNFVWVQQQIQKQHGPIMDLKICKGYFSESTELKNDMLTLAEYGIDGAAEGEPEVVCLIHYDFKPEQHDNPLLLATEQK
ncbi:hypothetical protein P3T76_008289 [Phytophthora citrophthora]|uniref:Uncharacterized protein n=1 Tax=Phytophthora citrophthora TaxID=4793 RepID=A0AAD9LKU3_9STRA|nr:hypothetical protein P3T76_008289 [Phytophthora citrophthora]